MKIFNSKTAPKKLIELKKYFEQFEKPIFPLKAQDLLEKYKLKEGKEFDSNINNMATNFTDGEINSQKKYLN